jgi:hypothetical protein
VGIAGRISAHTLKKKNYRQVEEVEKCSLLLLLIRLGGYLPLRFAQLFVCYLFFWTFFSWLRLCVLLLLLPK